jgi:WD40 repeat protein
LAALRQPSLTIDVVGPGRVVADQGVLTQNVAEWRMPPTDALAPPERWWTRGASVDRQPVFTPDGSKLVFNSDRGGNLDLWELDLTGGGVHRLTFDPGDDWDPGLTPDGSRLLWSSNRSGNFEIWTAAADGSGARQLTRDGVDAENPTATPDGAWIVYASANPAQSGIWRIRADGSEARHLVRGAVSLPEVSPNGRWISTLDIDREQLRVVELEDGAEVAAIPLPYQTISVNQVGRSRWLPGTSTLVWIDFDPAESVSILVAQPIVAGRDTGAERRTLLRGTPDAMPESFAISPDGTRIFVSVNESRSDLVLVEGLPGVRR